MLKDYIFNETLRIFSISKENLFNKKRGLCNICRQYMCYWLYNYTPLSFDDIAVLLQYNDTGSVSYNIKVISDKKLNNPSHLYDEFFIVDKNIQEYIKQGIESSTKPINIVKEDFKNIAKLLSEVNDDRLGKRRRNKLMDICNKYKNDV
jgi:chromosomal replication initiation ATPase DnaA